MSFTTYLKAQIKYHPSVQPQDIVKLCFQAAYGAEHLLSDFAAAENYLKREFEAVGAKEEPLYEQISESVCRVNLAAWKYKGLPVEWLFRMFAACAGAAESQGKAGDGCEGACQRDDKDGLFFQYLQLAEQEVEFMQKKDGFSAEDWKNYLKDYLAQGIRAVHHSSHYRKKECPAYRIVNVQYMRLLPILERIAESNKVQSGKDVFVIAIDGRAASGKSTMATQLQYILGADVVRMDDFFLPLSLRNEERFLVPGSNVHYERFIEEVLPGLTYPEEFTYRIFDCSKMDFGGERMIRKTPFRIVEGSYSCHPQFGNYADLTVFSDVEQSEQLRRIERRNGSRMLEMFRDRWIPLEEEYFHAYQIEEKAQVRTQCHLVRSKSC